MHICFAYFAYYLALHIMHQSYNFAYFAYCLHIFCIFCILFPFTYYAYYAYVFAYLSILFCILSCILCIFLYILFCIFCILFCILFCIFYILLENHKALFQVIHCSCHYCLVPHPRGQLLTYHHLQLSLLSFVLSQTAPGKSLTFFACRTVSSLSGGSRPSMLYTGKTYNICAVSLRWYTMVD